MVRGGCEVRGQTNAAWFLDPPPPTRSWLWVWGGGGEGCKIRVEPNCDAEYRGKTITGSRPPLHPSRACTPNIILVNVPSGSRIFSVRIWIRTFRILFDNQRSRIQSSMPLRIRLLSYLYFDTKKYSLICFNQSLIVFGIILYLELILLFSWQICNSCRTYLLGAESVTLKVVMKLEQGILTANSDFFSESGPEQTYLKYRCHTVFLIKNLRISFLHAQCRLFWGIKICFLN